jgi:hypothetical protein
MLQFHVCYFTTIRFPFCVVFRCLFLHQFVLLFASKNVVLMLCFSRTLPEFDSWNYPTLWLWKTSAYCLLISLCEQLNIVFFFNEHLCVLVYLFLPANCPDNLSVLMITFVFLLCNGAIFTHVMVAFLLFNCCVFNV